MNDQDKSAQRSSGRSPADATRWMQLTLVEDDPKDFDADLWRRIFIDSGSNATCLSAGGYVAYYPSDIAFHHVSRWIGDRDPFGELVAIARDLDMHVMARIDPHAIHADAAAAYPEWVQIDAAGNPREHWAYPGIFVTCALGPYNRDFMSEVVREIGARYDIDAVFANRWAGHDICYCASCRAGFLAASGEALPRRDDDATRWARWREWRRVVLTELVLHWDRELKSVRPTATFIPNIGVQAILDFNVEDIERFMPFLFVDHQGRHGVEAHWAAGRNGKRMRGMLGDKPCGLITSVGPEEVHRWKDAVQSPIETLMWIVDGVAHGLLPWCTKFGGRVADRRWLDPINRGFAAHAGIEDMLAATAPSADVALLDPGASLRPLDVDGRRDLENHGLGAYHALVEGRIPFEMVSDVRLDDETLAPYRVLVIPSAPRLSDAQIDTLARFVARGGALIAMFDAGSLDENGAPRTDDRFDILFGMRRNGPPSGPLRNTYIALDPAFERTFAAGIEHTDRIIGGTRHVDIKVTDAEARVPLRFFPSVPDLPMEEVFARGPAVVPAAVCRQHVGGGKTAYFALNLGAVFWDVLSPDHGRLIANAVLWGLGGAPSVTVDGPGLIDFAVRRSDRKLVVTVVNITNPMSMKGPVRDLLPIGPVTVRFGPDAGVDPAADATLVLSGRTLPLQPDGGDLSVTLDRLELTETVVADLG